MLRRYAEKILEMYTDVDDIMIVSNEQKIEFYKSYRPELNIFKDEKIIGKDFQEVFPFFNKKNSSVIKVLEKGEPIMNHRQIIRSFNGKKLDSICSTIPIKLNDEIIGAADIAKYVTDENSELIPFSMAINNVSQNTYYRLDDIITQNPQMISIKEMIHKIADTDSSVMISGDTGTGKELVAQALHSHSYRQNKPFISQNCAAIPSTLLEALLFGTVKGSFTGAEDKPGLFELANGGTLFLDEVNSMDLAVQGKVLRAIEEKKITRVGDDKETPIDMRVVSALNESPEEAIRNNKIREDLFFRLSVIRINIPSLVERSDDILLLTDHFLKYFNRKMDANVLGIDQDVESLFLSYHWPGNIRELKNAIESAFNIASTNIITIKDIQDYLFRSPPAGNPSAAKDQPLSVLVGEYEKSLIVEALNSCGTKSGAAKKLGISKQSLNYKMEKYNIERNERFK